MSDAFIELPPIDLSSLEVPRRREPGRYNLPRTVKGAQTQSLVGRGGLFDSRNDTTNFTNGFASIATARGLTVKSTVTSRTAELWLAQFEVSFFVDQFAESNEWPNGTFFDASTNKTTAANYSLVNFTSAGLSTSSQMVQYHRLVNNTGATRSIGVVINLRYILNGGSRTDGAGDLPTSQQGYGFAALP